MPTITIHTLIEASPEICFDLARDVDAHTRSASKTKERVISVSNLRLLELGDEVTFEANHFGLKLRLTSKITEYERPTMFVDRMIKGTFQSLIHHHAFQATETGTLMVDTFTFTSPFGFIGTLVNHLILTRYMETFLKNRAQELKRMAEEHSQ